VNEEIRCPLPAAGVTLIRSRFQFWARSMNANRRRVCSAGRAHHCSWLPVIEASQHAGGAALSSGSALALSWAAPRQILNSGRYRPRCPIWPHSANSAGGWILLLLSGLLASPLGPLPIALSAATKVKLRESFSLASFGSIIVGSA